MREWHKTYLLWCLLLLPLCVRADTVAPPAAFWDYLEDFDAQDGELFDPLDLQDADQAARADARNTATRTVSKDQPNSQPQEESAP
jgi:hypothetical protein